MDSDRIVATGQDAPPPADTTVDCTGLTVTPGFIDMHSHGGAGAAFTDGPDAARRVVAMHAQHGTTTMMASLVSADADTLSRQVAALVPLVQDGTICGIHLEGPWISHQRKGAHDPHALRAPNPTEIEDLLAVGAGTIAMVTLAPELPGGIDAVRQLVAAGVVVALGHTSGDDHITREAIDAGATVATHLFNAMPALHHREPGPIGALLRDPRVTVELIADGIHVHPDVLAVVMAAAGADRIALVSDAMSAAGMADGDYELGSLAVRVTDGVARLVEGGALAGSTLTLDDALRRVVDHAGWSVDDAVTCLTRTPAHTLGLADRGALETGQRADVVLLDPTLQVAGVMQAGVWIVEPRR